MNFKISLKGNLGEFIYIINIQDNKRTIKKR